MKGVREYVDEKSKNLFILCGDSNHLYSVTDKKIDFLLIIQNLQLLTTIKIYASEKIK